MPDIKIIDGKISIGRGDYLGCEDNTFKPGYFEFFAPDDQMYLEKIEIIGDTEIDKDEVKIRGCGIGVTFNAIVELRDEIYVNTPFMFTNSKGKDIFSLGYVNE